MTCPVVRTPMDGLTQVYICLRGACRYHHGSDAVTVSVFGVLTGFPQGYDTTLDWLYVDLAIADQLEATAIVLEATPRPAPPALLSSLNYHV